MRRRMTWPYLQWNWSQPYREKKKPYAWQSASKIYSSCGKSELLTSTKYSCEEPLHLEHTNLLRHEHLGLGLIKLKDFIQKKNGSFMKTIFPNYFLWSDKYKVENIYIILKTNFSRETFRIKFISEIIIVIKLYVWLSAIYLVAIRL